MGTWYIPSLLNFNATGKYCSKMVFTVTGAFSFSVDVINGDEGSAANPSGSITKQGTFSQPGILVIQDFFIAGASSAVTGRMILGILNMNDVIEKNHI